MSSLIYLHMAVPISLRDPEKFKTKIVRSPSPTQDLIKLINKGQAQIAVAEGPVRSVLSSNILAILEVPDASPDESPEPT